VVQQQGRCCSVIIITEAYDGGVIRDIDVHDDPAALQKHTCINALKRCECESADVIGPAGIHHVQAQQGAFFLPIEEEGLGDGF